MCGIFYSWFGSSLSSLYIGERLSDMTRRRHLASLIHWHDWQQQQQEEDDSERAAVMHLCARTSAAEEETEANSSVALLPACTYVYT